MIEEMCYRACRNIERERMEAMQDNVNFRFGAIRGLFFALPISLILWAAIIWGAVAVWHRFHI